MFLVCTCCLCEQQKQNSRFSGRMSSDEDFSMTDSAWAFAGRHGGDMSGEHLSFAGCKIAPRACTCLGGAPMGPRSAGSLLALRALPVKRHVVQRSMPSPVITRHLQHHRVLQLQAKTPHDLQPEGLRPSGPRPGLLDLPV